MITHHKFDTLGGANHGWLNAKHHFSFANYFDPKKLSHGELLVINDDRIAPHTGFDTHPHRDMEIITYVRKGAITHKDNKGHKGRTTAGNVQVMSAGTGIFHSEYNLEDEETNIYQIWIKPKTKGIDPDWDMAEFPKTPVNDKLSLLVSGDGKAPLRINQDAKIFAGRLTKGAKITHALSSMAYILISEGSVDVSGIKSHKGDGLAVSNERKISLTALSEAEILIIEIPGKVKAR
ncbi:MAG: pirin family protein [Candidatus Puniceispirillaceae bacterium]